MVEPFGPCSELEAHDLTKDPIFSEPEGSLPKRRIRQMALSNSEKGIADFINIVPGELFAQGEILRWEDEKDGDVSLPVICPVIGPILSWDADVISGEEPIINICTSCCSYTIASFAPAFEHIYHELCDSATLKWGLWRSAEAALKDTNYSFKKMAPTTVVEIKALRNGFGCGLRTADDIKTALLDPPHRLLPTVLPSLNSRTARELAQSIVDWLCKAGLTNGQATGETQEAATNPAPSDAAPVAEVEGDALHEAEVRKLKNAAEEFEAKLRVAEVELWKRRVGDLEAKLRNAEGQLKGVLEYEESELGQRKKAAEELEAKLREAERQLREREVKERALAEKLEATLSEGERQVREREEKERELVEMLEATLSEAERQLERREDRGVVEMLKAKLSQAEGQLKEREEEEREVVQKLKARAFRLQHALRGVRQLEGEKRELEENVEVQNAKRRRVEAQDGERRRASSSANEEAAADKHGEAIPNKIWMWFKK